MVTRPTATVTITLDAHSDLVAEAASLRAEEKRLALAAARNGDDSNPRVAKIEARLAELEQHIAEGQIHVRLRTLGHGQYRDLLKNHPPKPDDEIDAKVGYDVDTFGAALIRAATLDATDHAGQPHPIDLDALLDDDEGVSPYDFEQWFRTGLALQTQGGNRVPLLRAS